MTAVYIILGVAAVLICGWLFLIFPSLRRHPDRKILSGMYIAHRGLHDLLPDTPENSLPAFREAAALGVAIENDIHITAAGEGGVFHDDTLKRMCGDERTVESCTLAELKELRLQDTDHTIPTLRECLDTVDGKVPLLIEFKALNIKTAERLCVAADKILSEYKGKYFVQSFYPPVLGWYKKNRKEICRGQLSETFKGEKISRRIAGLLLFNFISRPDFVSFDHKGADSFSRRAATRFGAFPVGWTFTKSEELEKGKENFKTYIFEKFLPDRER